MRETVNDRFYAISTKLPRKLVTYPSNVVILYCNTQIHTLSPIWSKWGRIPKKKENRKLEVFSSDWIFSCTQPTVLKHWMDSTRENHPLSWSIDGLTAEANGIALLWLFDNNSYGTETYTHLMQYSKPKCLCGEYVSKKKIFMKVTRILVFNLFTLGLLRDKFFKLC